MMMTPKKIVVVEQGTNDVLQGDSIHANTTYFTPTCYLSPEVEHDLTASLSAKSFIEAAAVPTEILGSVLIIALLILVLTWKSINSGERREIRSSEAEEYAAKVRAEAEIECARIEYAQTKDELDPK